MKVLLYSEGKSLFNKSGVGRALTHQKEALTQAGVEFTTDENEKYDVVHINTIGPGSDKILKKSKKSGIPVIYHTHTTFEDFRNSFVLSNMISPFIKKRLIKLYSQADSLISPSEYTKNLIKSYGIDKNIDVVSNGVDTNKFIKNRELADKFKEEYPLNKPLIICVGLPFRRKGIFDFCEVAKKLPDYQFIWFGAKMASLLPRDVQKLMKNPPENVKFPGYVSNEIILGAYSEAKAFFFPTYEENEGIVVLEALSMKTPVIVRDIPVYEKWLNNNKNAFKGKNIDEFIKIISEIDEDKIKNIVENGRKTAEERDLKIIGEKLKSIYKKVLKNV
ncbi:glycosyltransferase family 4 protein [Haliovirga abyssi]|uniref:Glycosyl transferase n=1 Tax=Haliovirga abyssi TaxID=2996794 RepID=A0AAU9D9Z8_9FUSO|nr:glycosyltransferase [Haliovirga abyssi]BDU51468.1 glycosyl transferase [Haliovirga abyssi]